MQPSTTRPGGQLTVLFTVCLAGMILPLNFVSGAVATPAIARELGGSAQALSWVTNSFMLTFGCFLMAAGALADEIGRKKVFISGVSLFALLSLLQAFSSSLLWIDLLRAAQGVAAAAALAGGAAALAQEFDGAARTRAFSLMGSSFGVGLAFGPFLAGALIAHFGWRSVFFSATVIAVLALITGASKMRETRNSQASGVVYRHAGAADLGADGHSAIRSSKPAGAGAAGRRSAAAGHFCVGRASREAADAGFIAVPLRAFYRRTGAAAGDRILLCRAAGDSANAVYRRERAERGTRRADDDGAFRTDAGGSAAGSMADALDFRWRTVYVRAGDCRRRAGLAESGDSGAKRDGDGCADADHWYRHRSAVGADGWLIGQRGSERTCGDGDRD